MHYEGPARDTDADALVEAVAGAVRPRTRLVALTWVQSDTGLKLPLRAIARRLRELPDPPLLCVDGTHGFGAETDRPARLGLDAFVADCHKWLYGPRGTGFVWARPGLWPQVRTTVATFSDFMDAFAADGRRPGPMTGTRFSPGGFHCFEHRWSIPAAFAFRDWVGGERRIRDRVHELATRLKRGLQEVPGVQVATPMSPKLSAGIVAFDVAGQRPREAVRRLRRLGVVATVAPYPSAHLRFTPGIYNDEDDLARGLEAVAALGRTPGGRPRRTRRALLAQAISQRRPERPRMPRRATVPDDLAAGR